MKRLVLSSAVSLALLSGCGSQMVTADAPATAQQAMQASVVKSPNDNRSYKVITLPNQLEVMLISDPTTEKSAASLSVGVGLLHDPMTQQGMAHYLEHMLFLGTENYPDTKGYSEFMTANGGAQNAYTWLDITNYMFSVNNDAVDEALARFSDFFKAPMLYPEYTEKEKSAVNAEWSMRREMDFFGQFKLARNLLGEHPANRFLIGNLESLGDKEGSNLHEETVAFYNQYYSANIMKVALLGNQSLAELEQLAVKHFSSIKNKEIAEPDVTATIDFAEVGGKRIHYVPNQDIKQLKLEFIIDDNSDQFAVKPNAFVSYLLGSEMPGTPAFVLKEQGLISSLNASADPTHYGNYGVFTVNLNLTDQGMQHREAITALLMQYIELIKTEGVDEKYFQEIRTSLANQFRFLEKSDEFGYVSNLAEAMQNRPAEMAIAAPFHYDAFDADAIRAVLDQLTPERLRIWYVSKQEPHDSELHYYNGKYKVVTISDEEQARWQQPSDLALHLPAVNRLLPENFDIVADTSRTTPEVVIEEPGLEIWHYPSQLFTDQPRGVLEIHINNTAALTSAKADVLLSIWRDLYSLQQSALMTEAGIAGMGVSLSTGTGLTLSLGGFTDKQPALLEQALASLKVDVNAQNFAQAIDRYVRALKNQSKGFAYSQAFGAYSKLLREGSFNTEKLIATAESLSEADLQVFMNELMAANTLRVFAFGNYDQAALANVAGELRAVFPSSRQVTDYQTARFWQPAAGTTLVWQQDIEAADVALVDVKVHPTPGAATKAQGRLLAAHFSNIVFDKLRTEEQLAYAVGGFSPGIDEYTGFGMFIQTPEKDVAAMQQRFEDFHAEYQQVLAEMSEAEFEQLKASTLVSLKEPAKNLREEVAPLLNDWYREKYSFDSKQQLIAAMEQVTLADLQSFYQATLLSDDAARINVQMRGTKFADKPFADLPQQTKVNDLQSFHQQMKKQ
ncbi:insulinase family protein [Pseudidiomarina sediminum]|uniref:insulinase family protein n=1 Tax=Pseudidiomarina sediminum TaxID=431675 RepID=UPI001C941EDB|nr:insulinase family protein [Pseudidiomarina sediminum]MBY6064391.1 insulinase family protein [Pseudidiomarina sediminum]